MSPDSIRDAVRAGDYRHAADCFAGYARSLPVEKAALREIAELTRWARITSACAQAHEHARLQKLRDELHVLETYAR